MKDFEILKLSESQTKDYFEKQEKTDRWITIYTNELEVTPLPDMITAKTGLFPLQTSKGITITGFESDVTDDDISSSTENTKTACIIPENNRFKVYPLRYTAFGHMQERSGITGGSISSLKERRRANEMEAKVRCTCINEGLKLYKDKTLVLIRDGKVTALLSGDESDYSIMPVSECKTILEDELSNSYKNYTFSSCQTTHDITEIIYNINDDELSERIEDVLSQTGELISDVKVKLRFTTSDVGKCAARLTPMFFVDGKLLPFGKPLSVEHKGGKKAMAAFKDASRSIMSKYRECIGLIQKLMNIHIKHPAGCLKNVYSALKLTGYSAALNECQDRIISEHTSGCTGYDIYWYLNEVLFMTEEINKKNGKEINLFTSIRAQETISEILFMDIKQYDYE